MAQVAILGGGLGGLLVALALEAAGVEVTVLEAESTAGGVARTIRRDGYALEPAVGTFSLPHPRLSPAFERVGLAMTEAGSANRYVVTSGVLRELAGPVSTLGMVPPRGWLRLLAEPLIGRPRSDREESLAEFLVRRLGDRAGRIVAQLLAAGVFAGDPGRLSASAAFPQLTQLEQRYGSLARGLWAARRSRPRTGPPRPHYPAMGMDGVADAIALHLGDRLLTGWKASAVRPAGRGWRITGPGQIEADHLVLAVPAPQAGALLGGELGRLLAGAASVPVVVAGFTGSGDLPAGFGALVSDGSPVLGILFESTYDPHRAPPGGSLIKVIAGGARSPEVSGWSDDRLAEVIGEEIRLMLGWPEPPRLVAAARRQIPQYLRGHRARISHLEGLSGSNLHLAGWWYRGVGVSQLAADAHRVAATISGREPK
jgi:oxygen-dependent protoporphyrinogen oxidase